jgi:hypothetical protein
MSQSSHFHASISLETFASSPGFSVRRRLRPTYYGPTQPLDPMYTPVIRLPLRLEQHFRPTFVTDAARDPHEDIASEEWVQRHEATLSVNGA